MSAPGTTRPRDKAKVDLLKRAPSRSPARGAKGARADASPARGSPALRGGRGGAKGRGGVPSPRGSPGPRLGSRSSPAPPPVQEKKQDKGKKGAEEEKGAEEKGAEEEGKEAENPRKRKKVLPKINENPEAPEMEDMENMKYPRRTELNGELKNGAEGHTPPAELNGCIHPEPAVNPAEAMISEMVTNLSTAVLDRISEQPTKDGTELDGEPSPAPEQDGAEPNPAPEPAPTPTGKRLFWNLIFYYLEAKP